jgi:hypothetical protein
MACIISDCSTAMIDRFAAGWRCRLSTWFGDYPPSSPGPRGSSSASGIAAGPHGTIAAVLDTSELILHLKVGPDVAENLPESLGEAGL